MLPFKAFRAQVDAGVLPLRLDDPPLNLIGPAFGEDLIALIQEAEASPAYRVVVFESAVANFFQCACGSGPSSTAFRSHTSVLAERISCHAVPALEHRTRCHDRRGCFSTVDQ